MRLRKEGWDRVNLWCYTRKVVKIINRSNLLIVHGKKVLLCILVHVCAWIFFEKRF